MIIGVPKEIKDHEYRVALTPGGAAALIHNGHQVLVEAGAGRGSGFADEEYVAAGAKLVDSHAKAFAAAEMVIKVKEPLPEEYGLLREGLILFTYLHLAAVPQLARVLLENKVVAVAYETVELSDGSLPLLTPMSEVAGRMAVQVGAYYLERLNGGRGVLLGGVPGVPPANVVILGAGVVGSNAARVALGMGANVILINRGLERLRYLSEALHGNLVTLASNPYNVAEAVRHADLLIGGVLITGAKAPRLVTREMIGTMPPGSVVVDVSVDQGGCVETCHPTTHSDPTYFVDGVLHYCVANMPGAVPRTSTIALSNATLSYALQIADRGLVGAVRRDPALAKGVNACRGFLTHEAVAAALGLPYHPLEQVLS
ncbi:MAG: alanine dehydrogenase [Chloroflexi bacterium]|nr:alanine dehydrogenase [Chloroflexota bacterium]MDA8187967.1 alanine dehydrogenase [Dehalococcoidales bacterium]